VAAGDLLESKEVMAPSDKLQQQLCPASFYYGFLILFMIEYKKSLLGDFDSKRKPENKGE